MANKSGVPGSLRRKIMRRDQYTCQKCGLVGREVRCPSGSFVFPTSIEGVYLSIDHIDPKSLGGAVADPDNLRVLCTTCNTKKGIKAA